VFDRAPEWNYTQHLDGGRISANQFHIGRSVFVLNMCMQVKSLELRNSNLKAPVAATPRL